MRFQFAIVTVAAAVLGLQQFAVSKSSSSSSSSQSLLDPLTIQEDTAQSKRKAKHNKFSKQKQSNIASAWDKHQRSKLSDDYELPSAGALTTFQKSPGMRAQQKAQKLAAKKKSSLAWNGSTSNSNKKPRSNNQRTASASTNSNKNFFKNAADTTGKVITAPARSLKALFKSKQHTQQAQEQ